jgi:hypothetical protein
MHALRFSNKRLILCWGSLVCLLLSDPELRATGPERTAAAHERSPVIRLKHLLTLDVEKQLEEITSEAEALLQISKLAAQETKAAKSQYKNRLPELPHSVLKEYFHDSPAQLSGRERRALEEIVRVANSARGSDSQERAITMKNLRELLAGLRNNRRSPLPASVGTLTPWKLWIRDHNRSIGHGGSMAGNLILTNRTDASLCDPMPSGFWRRPANIAGLDLASGFGRKGIPVFTNTIWEYEAPKTSSGTRPGFNIRSAEVELKVKLAEVSSEPFTARIFHALGYHVDPTDHASAIKIRYSRRLFREFNLRKPLVLPLRPFWFPVGSMQLQPYYDPFDFITMAVFKDGTRASGPELKSKLLIDPTRDRPEEDPANFRTDIEAALDYVVVGPANIQAEDSVGDTVGSWDFTGIEHENLRELRGAGLLAAWLGWFDSRFDNTRLRVVESEEHPELKFFFTDLGAGMGSGKGWLVRHGESAEAMEPAFTSPRIVRGPGRMTTPFRVRHFQTIVPTPAFQRMTFDDARWMARLIGQLTPAQLHSALIASGYSDSESALYLGKLMSRRDQMIRDLELAGEFAPLQSNSGSDLNSSPAIPRASVR